jgi:hypothetical protein
MISKLVHYSPLTDMFTRIVETKSEAAPSLLENRFREFAHSFATVRLVEQCSTACEMYAEELGDDPNELAMMNQLSECIAASDAFLAASVRESKHAYRYASLFGDIVTETAAACSRRSEKSAVCVEVMCRACMNFVQEDYGMVAMN